MWHKINSAFLIFVFIISQALWAGQGPDAFIDRAIRQSYLQETLSDLPLTNQALICRILPISAVPVSQVPTGPIPTSAIAAAKTAGSVASAVGIVSLSPSLVTQGSRVNAALNILSCQASSSYADISLGWADSPTFLTLGHGPLAQFDGAVVGNWALVSGLAGVHALFAYKYGAETVKFPGLNVLPALFLLSSTTEEAFVMLRFGNTTEQVGGGVSLAAQLGMTGAVTWLLLPANFPKGDKSFEHKYGVLFQDYREGRQWFITIESLMSMATGVLSAYNVDPSSTCSSLIYGATGVYGAYTAAIILLYPHEEKFDRAYFAGTALTQFASMALGAAEHASGKTELDPNSIPGEVSIGLPMALQWVGVIRTVFDMAMLVRIFYRYWQRIRHPAETAAPNVDKFAPLLTLPGPAPAAAILNPLGNH